MQRDCALRIAGRGRLMSFSVEYKTGNQSLFEQQRGENHHHGGSWDQWIREMTLTRPGSRRPRQTSRREDHHIVRNARVQPSASSAAIHAQPLTPTHQRLRLEWCHTRGNWTAAEWNQVVFSDGSKFNLSIEDNCVREWRPRGECLSPAFASQ
ncbi:transposable element Tcb2 transposase [Trichonephila clavipes]|nr:transposable element Tcb2 transposase [Trichonephila clavipes]